MKTVLDQLNNVPDGTLQFGKLNVTTAAQAIMLIAYSDVPHLRGSNIPFRNLQVQAQCDNFEDFCACLRIIRGYHGFDAEEVIEKGTPFFNIKRWYPEGNPNNGMDMFRFIVAREYGCAFYVQYVTFLNNNRLFEGNREEFTDIDFEDCMQCLKQLIKPSEFNIEKHPYEAQGNIEISYSVRFCWT